MSYFEIPQDKIKEMQSVGLNILIYFDDFCRKNNLTYFLCGGCCIGAVRSGGFIPWDDDVDVFMPRESYEKLKMLWIDTSNYEIQYTNKGFRCQSQFITICDKNTTFIKTYRKDIDVSHGVAMDILPLDGCPKGWRRKLQKLWALMYSLFIVEKAPENHGKLVYLIGKIALTLVPVWPLRYKIWRACEKRMSRYTIETCDYITELCSGPHYMKNEYPKAVFAYPIYKCFEGYKLPIPVGYDMYLKMAFGDYMELPPENKRVCHHEYEFMDMKNGYINYRGVKYLISKETKLG